MKITHMIFSIYYWLYFILVSLVWGTIATLGWLLTFWWDPARKLNNHISWIWSRFYFLGNPFWKLTINGREKVDNSIPTLLMANHLSMWDIFVLFLTRKHFHWVSKRSNVYIPMIGLDMIYSRTIFLDRDDPREVLKMIRDAVKRLEDGISVMIFPEGERSLTGRLQPFLGGAFLIAKKAKARIQPIAITQTYRVIPRDKWILNPVAHMTVTILDPIPVETVMKSSSDELARMCYDRIAAVLPEEHLPLPEEKQATP